MSEEKKKEDNQDDGIPHLVTNLQPINSQVGDHVLTALEHEDIVAVLTTVTGSKNGQQVVSIPLTGEHLQQVHGLIEEIHESDEPERVPCVGFHCFVNQDDADTKPE
ncbi:MAG: hypothetical protein QF718_01280 [Phycisphaerales bacterium]|jgi:hypothetical protein|nr:hypothetical protein [Phycisphaerales bacterium]